MNNGWKITRLPFKPLVVSYVLVSLDAINRTYTNWLVKLVILGIWNDSNIHLAFCDNLTSFKLI